MKKERALGPIVLSAEHKRAAASPEPVSSTVPKPETAPVVALRDEPQTPRRTLSR